MPVGNTFGRMPVWRSVLGALVLPFVTTCYGQVEHTIHFGASLIMGGFEHELVIPEKGLELIGNEANGGYDLHAGWLGLVGPEGGFARVGLGLCVRYRTFDRSALTSEYHLQPSSFYGERTIYDGTVRMPEKSIGIPLQVWFRAGGRSRVFIGFEPQFTFLGRCTEKGSAVTTTTHYSGPDFHVVSVTETSGSYDRVVDRSYSTTARLQLDLGYRFIASDSFMIGPEISLINDLLHRSEDQKVVAMFGLAMAWTIPVTAASATTPE